MSYVRLLLLALVAACGGHTQGGDSVDGGGTSSAGTAGNSSAAGNVGLGGGDIQLGPQLSCAPVSGGVPSPRIELLHPGPVQVMCGDETRVSVVTIGNDSGPGFLWYSQMLGNNDVFEAEVSGASACAGQFAIDARALVHFPPDAVPGQRASDTLRVTASYAPIGVIDADVSAVVVEGAFTLDPAYVDFGPVAIGDSSTLSVTVHNLSAAPLTGLQPTEPVPMPFDYRSFRRVLGEDGPSTPPIPPDGTDRISLSFSPEAAGDFSMALTLSPFPAGYPASCGATQTLQLHGTGTSP